GCVCDSGFLLYNDRCVPSQQCGCWHNGQHYPVGSEFWTDDTCSSKCTCPAQGSQVRCYNASCPAGQYCGVQNGKPVCLEHSYGICHVHGDPHYKTFDKVTHNFMGNCTYTLAKVCSNTTSLPYFNVEAKNEHRGNTQVSYVREVVVEVYGERVVILKEQKSHVLVGTARQGCLLLAGPGMLKSQERVGSSEGSRWLLRKSQMGNMGHEDPSAEPSTQLCEPQGCWGVRTSQAAVCQAWAGSCFPWAGAAREAGARPGAHGGVCAVGEQPQQEGPSRLTVSYDTDHSVEVKVPTTYFNLTCGMCGNFNNRRDDEYMMPNGQQAADSNALGESWQVPDSDPSCSVPVPSPPCSAEEEELYRSDQLCGILTTRPSSFESCHGVINPQDYFDTCLYDLCALDGGQEPMLTHARHRANATFCREYLPLPCQKGKWATPCALNLWPNLAGPNLALPIAALQCPPNSYYDPCMTGCPATCVDQQAPQNCSKPCVEGCACNSGFLLSGDTCVPEANCGCLFESNYYAVSEKPALVCRHLPGHSSACLVFPCLQEGESSVNENCTRRCRCEAKGQMVCSALSCGEDEVCKIQDGQRGCYPASTAVCHIYGDPHYSTFDGKLHHFQGSCNYTVVTGCDNSSLGFSVTTRNKHRGSQSWTALDSVALSLEGLHIALRKHKAGSHASSASGSQALALPHGGHLLVLLSPSVPLLQINGALVTLPASPAPGVTISLSGSYVRLQFSGDHELLVKVSEKYKGKLCGLCGTYTGSQQDDFMRPDGVVVPDFNDFGSSWMVPDDEWPTDGSVGEGNYAGHQEGGLAMAGVGQGRRGRFLTPGKLG
ncbi:hypothetical protein DV515_00019134, partial [Chloebia gouldiae]